MKFTYNKPILLNETLQQNDVMTASGDVILDEAVQANENRTMSFFGW